ncbi:hypothetical protein PCE1_001108 [Barthelona sp. PCE]
MGGVSSYCFSESKALSCILTDKNNFIFFDNEEFEVIRTYKPEGHLSRQILGVRFTDETTISYASYFNQQCDVFELDVTKKDVKLILTLHLSSVVDVMPFKDYYLVLTNNEIASILPDGTVSSRIRAPRHSGLLCQFNEQCAAVSSGYHFFNENSKRPTDSYHALANKATHEISIGDYSLLVSVDRRLVLSHSNGEQLESTILVCSATPIFVDYVHDETKNILRIAALTTNGKIDVFDVDIGSRLPQLPANSFDAKASFAVLFKKTSGVLYRIGGTTMQLSIEPVEVKVNVIDDEKTDVLDEMKEMTLDAFTANTMNVPKDKDTVSFGDLLKRYEQKPSKMESVVETPEVKAMDAIGYDFSELLKQALRTHDKRIFERVVQMSSMKVMRHTCLNLPNELVLTFLSELLVRIEGNSIRFLRLMPWIRSILTLKVSYILTCRNDFASVFSRISTIVDARLSIRDQLRELEGRLMIFDGLKASFVDEEDDSDVEQDDIHIYVEE